MPITPPAHPIHHRRTLTKAEEGRAVGALVGGAVGDALGAPFEFGAAGAYRATYPSPVVGGVGEMRGGGGFTWEAGEFTDDTQMALVLAESLLRCGGLDPDDVWRGWVAWSADANDVGIITRASLSHPDWRNAARSAHERVGRSASNGALMRVSPVGIAFARADAATATEATMGTAFEQATLTHHDPAAGWGAAVFAELLRRTILGADPFAEIDDVLTRLPDDQRAVFAALLSPEWQPGVSGAPANGSVWGCLAQAMWAVRHHSDFHDAVVAAVDLGGDTDTVACVAGALAGARCGVQAIPSRWTTYLHGSFTTPTGRAVYDNAGLQELARRLIAARVPGDAPSESPAGPGRIADRLFAADLSVAIDHAAERRDEAVLSLCRTGGAFAASAVRREVFLIDQDDEANPALVAALRDAVDTVDAWLDEGRTVLVHCHGGRSRTALVLKAWAMRRNGWTEPQAHDWLTATWPRYAPSNGAFVDVLRDRWPA